MTKLQALKVAFIEGLMRVPKNSGRKKKKSSHPHKRPLETPKRGEFIRLFFFFPFLNNEYFCCQTFRNRVGFLSSNWCTFCFCRSPDDHSSEKQEVTPSEENCAFLPPWLGRPLTNIGFMLPLPKRLRFPCPPMAKITNAACGLWELHLFKTLAPLEQKRLLSPQIEQMRPCPTA